MPSELEDLLAQLARMLAQNPRVRAVGLASGDRPFPEPGQGDLDLFIYVEIGKLFVFNHKFSLDHVVVHILWCTK